MGNKVSFGASYATGKIVHWDGSVHEFDQPLTVAELMLEHPQQVVVEFHSAVSQKRPAPLPADKRLEMRKVYLMVPVKPGKPVGLSGEESRRILLVVNSALHSNVMCSARFLPRLAARVCRSREGGVLPQRKEEEVMEKKNKEERCDLFGEYLPEMMEGMRPEYLSRQLSGKGWKPSLDTINEKKIKRRVSHWLFLKRF